MKKSNNKDYQFWKQHNHPIELDSYKMALEKSEEEYEKFNQQQRAIEKEASLKELEEDIKKLKKPKK